MTTRLIVTVFFCYVFTFLIYMSGASIRVCLTQQHVWRKDSELGVLFLLVFILRYRFLEGLAKEVLYYSVRHVVKPGVTGWTQVYYPYPASNEDALRKLEYDLYYLKNISFVLDLLVIFHPVEGVSNLLDVAFFLAEIQNNFPSRITFQ